MLDDPTCWVNQHFIVKFGHRVWWPLNMLDDVGTCLMQYQTFDPTSSNISFVLMLDAWNFVRLAGLNNMLHARIRTANSAVTIDTVCSRQCSLKMSTSEEAAQNIDQTSSKKNTKTKSKTLERGGNWPLDRPIGRQERTSIILRSKRNMYPWVILGIKFLD